MEVAKSFYEKRLEIVRETNPLTFTGKSCMNYEVPDANKV